MATIMERARLHELAETTRVCEAEEEYVVRLGVRGLGAAELDVALETRVVVRGGCGRASFETALELPQDVDPELVTAVVDDDEIEIRAPRGLRVRRHQVPILDDAFAIRPDCGGS